MKHTQGPWGISSESSHIIKKYDCLGETHVLLASAMGGPTSGPYFPESKEEVLANALLISAAPDLLQALQSICNAADNIDGEHVTGLNYLLDAVKSGYTAIAKATGEQQ